RPAGDRASAARAGHAGRGADSAGPRPYDARAGPGKPVSAGGGAAGPLHEAAPPPELQVLFRAVGRLRAAGNLILRHAVRSSEHDPGPPPGIFCAEKGEVHATKSGTTRGRRSRPRRSGQARLTVAPHSANDRKSGRPVISEQAARCLAFTSDAPTAA